MEGSQSSNENYCMRKCSNFNIDSWRFQIKKRNADAEKTAAENAKRCEEREAKIIELETRAQLLEELWRTAVLTKKSVEEKDVRVVKSWSWSWKISRRPS